MQDAFPEDRQLVMLNTIKDITGKDVKLANMPKEHRNQVCAILIYYCFLRESGTYQ